MSRRTEIVLLDDVDGSTAQQSVAFTLDGVEYEIDLTDEHAAQLRAAFESWRTHARAVAASRPTARQAQARSRHFGMIRRWGAQRGWDVPEKGRIPQDLQDAFYTAHRQSGA